MRVLVCDDEELMAELLRQALTEEGHDVDVAATGERAIDLASCDPYDLVVLDVMLPGLDGFATCRRLRERGASMPILMLTARADTSDRVTGLDAGADDYLAKPFPLVEFLARVRALARRGPGRFGERIALGDLELDLEAGIARRGGQRIDLAPRELVVLDLFMRHPGSVLTRERLHEAAWPDEPWLQSNVIEAMILRLRQKVDRPFGTSSIETVRGAGYRLTVT